MLTYKKVNGKENPADLCTKNLTQAAIDNGLQKIEMPIRSGRAELGLEANYIEKVDSVRVIKKVSWADLQEEEEERERKGNERPV